MSGDRLRENQRVIATNSDDVYFGIIISVMDLDQGDFEYLVAHDDGTASFWPRESLELRCSWFAMCENIAVRMQSHPILGEVPICQRCSDKIATL